MAKGKSKAAGKSKKGKEAVKKQQKAPKKVDLFESKPKNFGIGRTIAVSRDLTRFVRWPRYVKLQRQRRVLYKRLKTPPAIQQFTHTADKNTATNLFRLLHKMRPEDGAQKKERLRAAAAAGGKQDEKKPVVVKFGLNHVTGLIEQKKAKLVIIAHDVDPIETVVWMPALCRKMDVPYMVVKSKSRLGAVVHKKTASCLAICDVKKADAGELNTLVQYARDNFNNNVDIRRTWGDNLRGYKSRMIEKKRLRLQARDERRKQRDSQKRQKADNE